MTTTKTSNVIITPEAILSYPALFEPKEVPGSNQPPKYSCSLVFPPGTDITALKAAIVAAGRDFFGSKFDELWRGGRIRSPLRSDVDGKGYPEGSVFMNASSKAKPGIVSRYAGSDGKPQPITDPDEMYPGCYVIASVRFYGYDKAGNRGIGCGLGNLQKRAEGSRLDSRRDPSADFSADAGEAPFDPGMAAAADDLI